MNTKYPWWPDLTDDEGDALTLYFDTTCGDCVDGRCHWGGDRSRRSIIDARHGHEYIDPDYGACGCDRHAESVAARQFDVPGRSPQEVAVAWRDAREGQ